MDYTRPERQFGVTTNSLAKNLSWAKKGILSFSYVPLTVLSVSGTLLFCLTLLLMVVQIVLRLLVPAIAPRSVTTLLSILFFGSINLLAISLAGEYIAKIFEEGETAAHCIRRSMIRDEVRPAALSDSVGGNAWDERTHCESAAARRTNMAERQEEFWRPPLHRQLRPAASAKILTAVRRFLDLQMASIWADASSRTAGGTRNSTRRWLRRSPSLFDPAVRYIGIGTIHSKSHFGYEIPGTLYFEGDV